MLNTINSYYLWQRFIRNHIYSFSLAPRNETNFKINRGYTSLTNLFLFWFFTLKIIVINMLKMRLNTAFQTPFYQLSQRHPKIEYCHRHNQYFVSYSGLRPFLAVKLTHTSQIHSHKHSCSKHISCDISQSKPNMRVSNKNYNKNGINCLKNDHNQSRYVRLLKITNKNRYNCCSYQKRYQKSVSSYAVFVFNLFDHCVVQRVLNIKVLPISSNSQAYKHKKYFYQCKNSQNKSKRPERRLGVAWNHLQKTCICDYIKNKCDDASRKGKGFSFDQISESCIYFFPFYYEKKDPVKCYEYHDYYELISEVRGKMVAYYYIQICALKSYNSTLKTISPGHQGHQLNILENLSIGAETEQNHDYVQQSDDDGDDDERCEVMCGVLTTEDIEVSKGRTGLAGVWIVWQKAAQTLRCTYLRGYYLGQCNDFCHPNDFIIIKKALKCDNISTRLMQTELYRYILQIIQSERQSAKVQFFQKNQLQQIQCSS